MQCYPPVCINPNPNVAPTIPCSPFPVQQTSCPFPQVIGEGDVASVALPDGSSQLYFIPKPRCTPATFYTPPYTNVPWNCNPEAWFIRSIPNQFPSCQSAALNPQYQRITLPCVQNSIEYCATNPGYQLKFHNDSWTSTTDIHYFYPTIRKCNWFPKQSVSVQVDPPPPRCVETRFQQTEPICLEPCHCARDRCETKRVIQVSTCCHEKTTKKQENASSRDSCSSMSVDATRDETNDSYHKNKFCKKKNYRARFSCDTKKGKSHDHECECDLQPTPCKSDKCVATYCEQAAGCDEEGPQTQSTCRPSTDIRRVNSFFRVNNAETEFWYPKTHQSKKAMVSVGRRPQGSDSDSCTTYCSDLDPCAPYSN